MQRFLKVYMRVLGFLGPHWPAAAGLCVANVALVGIGFVEPVLFGHVVGGLSGAGPSTANILTWAATHAFNWHKMSVSAALAYRFDGRRCRLFFQTTPNSYNTEKLISFLKHLKRTLRGQHAVVRLL